MGNTVPVSDGNKEQVDKDACGWYRLLNLRGEGEFVELIRDAEKSHDYSELDGAIREKIRPYLYNNGEGKYIPVSELIHVRRCYREGKPIRPPDSTTVGYLNQRKVKKRISDGIGKHQSGPRASERIEKQQHIDEGRSTATAGKRGRHKDFSNLSGEEMRFVCWDIYQRGTVGETMMHACLLLGMPLFSKLTKRLMMVFPKLLADIYISDIYYGESVLHMAIVNEDAAMVKYLLDHDEWSLHHSRCIGSFFSAFDQKNSRTDNPTSEQIDLKLNTNYQGFVHWGEYPISFCAVLKQEECLRLLVARGASCNVQDTNGNTVLHMCVIHKQPEMFDLAYNLGANLTITNRRGLTPLTLAAELGHVDMYNHIMVKERRVKWIYRDTSCAEYCLDGIDSVDKDGHINIRSALHLIVYGSQAAHLEMVQGTIITLLEEKWKIYIRSKFLVKFVLFILYYAVLGAGFLLKPKRSYIFNEMLTDNSTNQTMQSFNSSQQELYSCYLIKEKPFEANFSAVDIVRYVCELLALLGALSYSMLFLYEIYRQGWRVIMKSIQREPVRGLFQVACLMLLLQVPGRITCAYGYEDTLSLITIMCTAPYFLFFCKGFRLIGPFVLMIIKMITGDVIRFLIIYMIFNAGFSQGMYLCFMGYTGEEPSILTSPDGAYAAMFYMSMGEFYKLYESMHYTRHQYEAKALFLVYMLIVYILLINMLIAMMANTYQLINDTTKEYLRQWAQVVLAIENSVSSKERLGRRLEYSEPMNDGSGGRALVVRWKQSELEKRDIARRKEEKRAEQKEQYMKIRREKTKRVTHSNLTPRIAIERRQNPTQLVSFKI